jgi:hypothetical protein
MLPNRKKSSKNVLGGKKSVKAEKTEKEEEEELEALKLELENEQKKAEETENITKELEKRLDSFILFNSYFRNVHILTLLDDFTISLYCRLFAVKSSMNFKFT